jgi:hypothetical protein
MGISDVCMYSSTIYQIWQLNFPIPDILRFGYLDTSSTVFSRGIALFDLTCSESFEANTDVRQNKLLRRILQLCYLTTGYLVQLHMVVQQHLSTY